MVGLENVGPFPQIRFYKSFLAEVGTKAVADTGGSRNFHLDK